MRVYKIVFMNKGKIYEIFARTIHQGELYGFVEIEDLIFQNTSSVLVDPSEEKLRDEFKGVRRTYIPMHSVIRIDEVGKEGQGKILDIDEGASNITHFPTSIYSPEKDRDK